jgi:hypothetical protein
MLKIPEYPKEIFCTMKLVITDQICYEGREHGLSSLQFLSQATEWIFHGFNCIYMHGVLSAVAYAQNILD